MLEQRIVAVHAAAVVRTAISLRPPAVTATSICDGPGIERVLEQFLNDRGRTLDHFAGRDFVRHVTDSTRIWFRYAE